MKIVDANIILRYLLNDSDDLSESAAEILENRCETMIIKPSAALRNDYSTISNLAKETKEPIYITKNGEGDLVLMSIDAFEKREQILQLRAKVLQAEQERISGAETLSVSEARRRLRERIDEV